MTSPVMNKEIVAVSGPGRSINFPEQIEDGTPGYLKVISHTLNSTL
jgi:hypothetical protein